MERIVTPSQHSNTPEQDDSRTASEQIADIRHAPRLMEPGGGSLETTAAVKALFALCCAQQREIEELRRRVDAHSKGVPWA